MCVLLLALTLFQFAPQRAGVVTGLVRGASAMPAAGVRVYAIAVREADTAGTPPALESLAETDASGRYRLEVQPGRYYLAAGSVGDPTYYPGTTDIAAARIVNVTAGGILQGIDFSGFVPA